MFLHQSLAERASPHEQPAVIVLHGPGYDLAGAGRAFIHEYRQCDILEPSCTRGIGILSGRVPSFGVNDGAPAGEELVGKVDRSVEEAAAIASKVQYQPFHA